MLSPSPAAPTTAPATGATSRGSGPVAPSPLPSTKATTKAAGTSPATFSAITVQAEAATLSGGAGVVECATCLAYARVAFIGQVDIHITVPVPGTRTLTIVYEIDGTRSFTVSINGGTPVAIRTVTGTGWTTPHSLTFSAGLPAGSVDITIYGYAGNAPDLDAVTIS